MEEEDRSSPPLRIPHVIFAVDHEPVGVRVTPYHKPYAIRQILNTLDPEEVDTIEGSSFGKLIEIGRSFFLRTFWPFHNLQQLLVSSKHEAWFIFAVNSDVFSSRVRHEVPITSVVRMLKKRTVKDRCIRVKYALLALLAAVILPTTHTPRFSQDHAELIKDIDDFFAYPWGRVSFDMLMSSIIERKEVSLSQNTIALKGFVLSLQLVMFEAIPALTEVVNDGSSSGSESDGCEEDDLVDEDKNGKRSLSPGYARVIDAAGEVTVHSIIVEDKEHFKASPDLGCSDDEEDPIVDNLMSLLEQQFPFNKSSFTGGVTKLEVNRMREDAKTEAINRKIVKPKQTKQTTTSEHAFESFITFQTNVLKASNNWFSKLEVSYGGYRLALQQMKMFPMSLEMANIETSAHFTTRVGIHTNPPKMILSTTLIRFANQTTSLLVDTQRDSHEEMITDHPPVAILFSNQANSFSVDVASNTSASLVVHNDMI
ncbi:hypothetical protein Bca101_037133 [Brassica carinata]